MDDLISRQAAIDVLDVLCQEHRYKIPGKIETYSQYNEAWQDALDRAEGAIFNLPSAEPETQWIPCRERLPAYGEDVLISIGGYCNVGHIVPVNEEEQYNWYFSGWYHFPNDVDAWMPLPEPYKAERKDE